MLAQDEDQRLVEQAPLFQVEDQCRKRLVEDRQQELLQSAVVVVVRVPRAGVEAVGVPE